MQAFRYPRNSQPQGSTRFSSANGLVGAVLPKQSIAVGNPLGAVSKYGCGTNFVRASSQYISVPLLNPIIITNTGATLIAICGMTGLVGSMVALANTTSYFSILSRGDAGYGAAGATWDGANFRQTASGSTLNGTPPSVFVVTVDPSGNFNIFNNGVKQIGTVTNSGAMPTTALTQLNIAASLTSGDYLDGNVFFGGGYGRVLTDSEIASISANPWQIFTPIAKQRYPSAGPLIIRPAGDVTTTGWTSTGANFYDQINEVTANDTNYITSPDLNSSPAAYKWTITPTPLAAGTWAVSVRCSDVAASGQIRIRFLDAGSASVGVSSYQTVTGAFATQTHTVVTSASAVYGAIEVAP